MPLTAMTVPTGMAVVMAENVSVATDPVPDAPVMLIVVAVLLGEMKYESGVKSSVFVAVPAGTQADPFHVCIPPSVVYASMPNGSVSICDAVGNVASV